LGRTKTGLERETAPHEKRISRRLGKKILKTAKNTHSERAFAALRETRKEE